MIERRNAGHWRMVSASVIPSESAATAGMILAYVFWESEL
jgi:hypothetical protein